MQLSFCFKRTSLKTTKKTALELLIEVVMVILMNVLILAEDEKQVQELTKEMMSIVPNVYIMGCKSNMEAYKAIIEQPIDLVLTELESTDHSIDGFDILKQSRIKNPDVESVIFIQKRENVILALDLHPYACHVKPIDIKAFRKQLHEIWDIIKRKKRKQNHFYDRFVIRNQSEYLCVPFNDILFFETHSKKTAMHDIGQEIKLKRNLTELERELPSQFVRIHKSYIANINNVSKITEIGNRSYEVSFYNSDKIALMSRYKAEKIFKIIKECTYD